MSEKSNIDRLFQEKFKDFEAAPPAKAWGNIQSQMANKEKEAAILPFWLQLCSFTAVFLIGFSIVTTFIAAPLGLTNPFFNTEKENTIAAPHSSDNGEITENNAATGLASENKGNDGVSTEVSASANEASGSNVSAHTEKKLDTSSSLGATEKRAYSQINANNSNAVVTKTKNTTSNNVVNNNQNAIVSNTAVRTDKNTVLKTTLEKGNNSKTIATKSRNTFNTVQNNTVIKEESSNAVTKNTSVVVMNSTAVNENSTTTFQSEDEIAKKEHSKNLSHDSESFFNHSAVTKVAYESGNRHVVTSKENNNRIVSENNTENSNANTTVTATNVTAAKKTTDSNKDKNLEKGVVAVKDSIAAKQNAVADKKEEKKADEEKDKNEKKAKKREWVVSSNMSPVYMNLNGTGSALDSKFANNSKTYQTSMTYGVGLKYALNEKWAVRTGMSVLNLEYSTNGINYYYSPKGAGLENVEENAAGSGIVVVNPNPKAVVIDDGGIVTKRYNGNINHRINYIEVPLEVTYNVINKKFGMSVIGGMSSIFLNDNKVSLVSAESNITIGSANNLNKMHYSTNVGLGFRYNFMKSLQANLEPMFKYQINTYNGDAGNFKPYFFGVYSGVSYKF